MTLPNPHDPSAALVSIVIPAYNAARTLRQTLESVLAQTYSNIEVIVVDDGSTDATAEVLKSFGQAVRSLYQPNRGLPNARNAGCASARGEFIALMDADDLCMPERIAVQLQAMRRFPAAVLCSSDFAAFNEGGLVAPSYAASYYSTIQNAAGGLRSLYSEHAGIPIASSAKPASESVQTVETYFGSIYHELIRGNFVHPPTVLFRRSILAAIGMFDEGLRYTCDWEWMVRASRVGPFVYVNRSMLEYRLSEVQMSSRQFNGGKSAVDVVRAAKKIWHADPELLISQRQVMHRDLGEFCLDAAEALADRNKSAALKMLAQSVWYYGPFKAAMLRITLKILIPLRLLNIARDWRQRLRAKAAARQWLHLAIPFSVDVFAFVDSSHFLSLFQLF